MKVSMRTATQSVAIFLWAFAAKAAPVPTQLSELKLAPAELTVVSPSGEAKVYSPESLEELPTYQLKTRTPWRENETNFEGVLLRDLLQAHGLADVPAIRIVAENDYISIFEREVWESANFLIATRVDGAPHSRRSRGPLQIVLDEREMAESSLTHDGHLVWAVAVIEAAD